MADRSSDGIGPHVIGLTGNIATGKSLVGEILSALGAQHIDADRLAHQAMAPGTQVWKEIVATFGPRIVQPDGAIDRRRLGAIVFGDPDALVRLEAMVHPEVIAQARRLIEASRAPVVAIEAIKLLESGMADQLCDAVWVVTAPRKVQIERLMGQRQLSYADAVLRIDAQPPQEVKLAQADVIIDNSGTVEATVRQVERAWAEIRLCDVQQHQHALSVRCRSTMRGNIRWT